MSPAFSFIGCQEAKFLISQQKYLEYLETGKTAMALHVLRNELAPLQMDPEQLQPLSSLIMCLDAADLKQKTGWDGARGSSRRRLLVNLQSGSILLISVAIKQLLP